MQNFIFIQKFMKFLPAIEWYVNESNYRVNNVVLHPYDLIEASRDLDVIIGCIKGMLNRFGIDIRTEDFYDIIIKLLETHIKK